MYVDLFLESIRLDEQKLTPITALSDGVISGCEEAKAARNGHLPLAFKNIGCNWPSL